MWSRSREWSKPDAVLLDSEVERSGSGMRTVIALDVLVEDSAGSLVGHVGYPYSADAEVAGLGEVEQFVPQGLVDFLEQKVC